MAYTIEELAADCRDALVANPGPGGQEQIRHTLERALKDDAFMTTHLGPQADSPRDILYEDPDFGFCIVAHVYAGSANPPPHDHGPTWAVYGQAAGMTEMTDWRLVEPPRGDHPGKVAPVHTYELHPGETKLYHVGDVHSPRRERETRLIRIEGQNLDKIKRDRFEPAR